MVYNDYCKYVYDGKEYWDVGDWNEEDEEDEEDEEE